MKTINIKGKAYVQVNERVKAFRTAKEFEGMAIDTIVHELTDEVCVMCTRICNKDGKVIATGWAREVRNDATSMVNKTSYVENCETSAVGRALGFLGIGIEENICSAEEMRYALQAEEQQAKAEAAPKTKAEPAVVVPSADLKVEPQLKTKEQEDFDALLADISCAENMQQLEATMLLAQSSPYIEALRKAANNKAQQNGWRRTDGKH